MNYEKRMQRLRKRVKAQFPEFQYPQNAARHCFASYHIAYHRDATQTAFLLGHPNPSLLYSTYRELVTFQDAEKYWNLLPRAAVERAGQDEANRVAAELAKVRKLDRLKKMEAETQSNIGKAVKGEDGHWHPIMDEALYGATHFNEFEV